MSLFSLLNGRNYGVYNRSVAREIGLKTTVFLSELIDKYEYFLSQEALVSLRDEEGLWFYVLVDDMEDRTTLGEKEQRSCVDHLVTLGFIKKTVAGQPAKRYFQINEEKIQEFLISKIKTIRSSQREELVPPKGQTRSCVREELDPPKRRNSHIYKNHIEEPKEIERAPPPTSTPESENFFKNKFDNRVVVTKENYDRLLEKFKDANLIESYAEKLHRWSFNNYNAYKDKKRHDMVIEDWIEKDQKENPHIKGGGLKEWIAKLKERVIDHHDIDIGDQAVCFNGGQSQIIIKFSDHSYKEQIKNRLRLMKISVDGL